MTDRRRTPRSPQLGVSAKRLYSSPEALQFAQRVDMPFKYLVRLQRRFRFDGLLGIKVALTCCYVFCCVVFYLHR